LRKSAISWIVAINSRISGPEPAIPSKRAGGQVRELVLRGRRRPPLLRKKGHSRVHLKAKRTYYSASLSLVNSVNMRAVGVINEIESMHACARYTVYAVYAIHDGVQPSLEA
jgi:hypothetical protein